MKSKVESYNNRSCFAVQKTDIFISWRHQKLKSLERLHKIAKYVALLPTYCEKGLFVITRDKEKKHARMYNETLFHSNREVEV